MLRLKKQQQQLATFFTGQRAGVYTRNLEVEGCKKVIFLMWAALKVGMEIEYPVRWSEMFKIYVRT
jgi:hypothetical protein